MVGMWRDQNTHRLMLSRRCGYGEVQKAVMKQHARSYVHPPVGEGS